MKECEIWLIYRGPKNDTEIRTKELVIVLQDNSLEKDFFLDRLGRYDIAPMTEWKEYFAFRRHMVKILPDDKNNLYKVQAADCSRIHRIPDSRLIKKIGIINSRILNDIHNASPTHP
jgi:mRNA interferase MazF